MAYLGDSTGFSQFDRDNMARWCTAAYINEANAILPKILASPRAGEVSGVLQDADATAGNALAAYQSMDYAVAVVAAKRSYEEVLAAADAIRVPIEPEAWQADRRARASNDMFNGAIDDFRRRPSRER
jgi:hypothetical protein